MTEKPELFVRKASGLVREVSTSKAIFFSIAGALAWTPAWIPAYVTFQPAFMVGGWTGTSFVNLIAGLFTMLVLTPIYAYLATALPRSGGDQVYTTRITHPLAGFIESWTFIFSLFAFWGYALSILIYNISASFEILKFSAQPEPWNTWATALYDPTTKLIVGTILMAIVLVASIQPTRRFHTINSAIVVVGLILSALIVPFLGGVDMTAFARNLEQFTGKTIQAIVAEAAADGFTMGTMEARSVMLGIAIMLLGFIGFQYSGFIAGELKGKVSRSITIALMITCVVVMLLYTVYLQLFTTVFGTDLIFALSYLFYTAGTSPITPLGQTLIAVAKPELAGIMAASAFGSFLIGFAYAIVAIATASRTAFAWATDRLIPTSLATVNARTKSPLRLIFIFFAIWYISFLGSIYGVTFITGAMTSILLSIFIWILPGVNAVLLPYRRPDLYELLPKSMRKTYGLPLVTILGIIWLLFSVPVYFVYAFWPIISEGFGKHMMGFFDYALSTGIMLTIGIVVVGVAIYYASKWYNKRQGIDMDMVFKSVPPE